MYDTSWYEKLRKQLKTSDQNKELRGQETLLLQVELGLRLLEKLNLADEPITVLWVVLSGLPIPHPTLLQLNETQKRMVANARILLPFFSRYAWEDALRDYAHIPVYWRAYQVEAKNLDRQLVVNVRLAGQFDERLTTYDSSLTLLLAFKKQIVKPAPLGKQISFITDTPKGKNSFSLTLPESFAPAIKQQSKLTMGSIRERQPWSVGYYELKEAAVTLDRNQEKPNWVKRTERFLHYRAVQPDGELTGINERPLEFNGMMHLVGMVGSGKSTLMSLLAAHAVLKTSWRITLIVGDTMTALRMADQFNRLLGKDKEQPVAVALLGRSTRDKHLVQLYNASDFHENHTGLRWLNTVCPLQGAMEPKDLPDLLPIGREPCQTLAEVESTKKSPDKFVCPLFHICPSHQVYQDMPDAQIWITTPGAMGSASVPIQVDARRIKLGDLIYEQSDIVVFDEVDTIQEWFDNLLAPEVKLFDPHGSGILDQADVHVAHTWIENRPRPAADRRWRKAERQSVETGASILSQLEQVQILPQWIQRNYFSALSLFFKLSRRLVDLPDYSQEEDDPKKVEHAALLFEIFKALTADDLMRMQMKKDSYTDPVSRLAAIAERLVVSGDSSQDNEILVECETWIQEFVPEFAATANNLQKKQEEWDTRQQQSRRPPAEPRPDDLRTLAQRLEFALHVAILDRNLRVVFFEWEKHEATDTPQPKFRAPQYLMRMLPVPPTGKLFGSYFSQDIEPDKDVPFGSERPIRTGRLSVFGYNNIGRWYISHFHELRTALDGLPGPHVLAMSGTSWLPDSSRWHFEEYQQLPQGILESTPDTVKAIQQSRFKFLPQYEQDVEGNLLPLRVSGDSDKQGQIRKVIKKLMGIGSGQAHLPELLAKLEEASDDLWHDRARVLLLVNSYAQARTAAIEIQRYANNDLRSHVYYLMRSEDSDEDELIPADSLARQDIEQFAGTGGKILVAPLQAIGRGYNILNKAGKAAFGAVYFLTRPMPHPYDTQAIVRELNHKTLAWCQDENFHAWHEGSLYDKGTALRLRASQQWRQVEQRRYYSQLSDEERLDLAATTAGLIIQACGRLLRGGVPFEGYFVDAAWSPGFARKREPATARTSLLAAVIQILQKYTMDSIGEALYEPLYVALAATENFDYDN
jgi:hypothetical protein